MPSKSPEQRRFMWLVHDMQRGSRPKSGKAGKAADTMNPGDVQDFLMQEIGMKECGRDAKMRLYTAMKEIIEPMWITEEYDESEDEQDTIAAAKTFHGDYDKTVQQYRGTEFTPQENQAIQNFDKAKPTAHDKFKVVFTKTDFKGNASTMTVKKILDKTQKYIYLSLVKKRGSEDVPPPEPEPEAPAGGAPPAPGGTPPAPAGGAPAGAPPLKEAEDTDQAGDEIQLIKSVPFDGQSGDAILTNFLAAVFLKMA